MLSEVAPMVKGAISCVYPILGFQPLFNARSIKPFSVLSVIAEA